MQNEFFRGPKPLEQNHSSRTSSLEEQVRLAPLPTEIPLPPDLRDLPPQILHSGAVETLIGQNEDLMSRLKVSLRRNSTLEQQILDLDKKNSELKSLNASLRSQNQIYHEKDRLVRDKSGYLEERFERMRDELQLSQIRLNEFEKASKSKIRDLESQVDRFVRYRARIKKYVHSALERAKFELHKERTKNSLLQDSFNLSQSQLSEWQSRFNDLEKRFNNLETNTHHDQARLIEHYEAAIKDLQNGLKTAKLEAYLNKDKALRVDELQKMRNESENRNIILERRISELEMKASERIALLESEVKRLLTQLQLSTHDAQKNEREAKRHSQEILEIQREKNQIEMQLMSLQDLLNEKIKNSDTERLQIESLQRLNRELSFKLKDQRMAEIHSVSSSHISAAFPTPLEIQEKSQEKSIELSTNFVEAAPTKKNSENEESNQAEKSGVEPKNDSHQRSKIGSLFSKLQQSFPNRRRIEENSDSINSPSPTDQGPDQSL